MSDNGKVIYERQKVVQDVGGSEALKVSLTKERSDSEAFIGYTYKNKVFLNQPYPRYCITYTDDYLSRRSFGTVFCTRTRIPGPIY